MRGRRRLEVEMKMSLYSLTFSAVSGVDQVGVLLPCSRIKREVGGLPLLTSALIEWKSVLDPPPQRTSSTSSLSQTHSAPPSAECVTVCISQCERQCVFSVLVCVSATMCVWVCVRTGSPGSHCSSVSSGWPQPARALSPAGSLRSLPAAGCRASAGRPQRPRPCRRWS